MENWFIGRMLVNDKAIQIGAATFFKTINFFFELQKRNLLVFANKLERLKISKARGIKAEQERTHI